MAGAPAARNPRGPAPRVLTEPRAVRAALTVVALAFLFTFPRLFQGFAW